MGIPQGFPQHPFPYLEGPCHVYTPTHHIQLFHHDKYARQESVPSTLIATVAVAVVCRLECRLGAVAPLDAVNFSTSSRRYFVLLVVFFSFLSSRLSLAHLNHSLIRSFARSFCPASVIPVPRYHFCLAGSSVPCSNPSIAPRSLSLSGLS